jgi:hypothetical protein
VKYIYKYIKIYNLSQLSINQPFLKDISHHFHNYPIYFILSIFITILCYRVLLDSILYPAFWKSLCIWATVHRFGCQYQSCRCSVLLFHCIQLLNSAQRLKCNTGKVCDCLIQLNSGSGLYRRSWTSLPTPFVSAQRLSESIVFVYTVEAAYYDHFGSCAFW